MKKNIALFFILFSVGVLSAQNLNFKDTNAIKTLLCSHAWIRYAVNPDSSFSDRIMDSIKFYQNGSFFESPKPKNDTIEWYLPAIAITGRWYLGSVGRASRSDTATNCLSINLEYYNNNHNNIWHSFTLVDGHRINNTKLGKMLGKIDNPFLGDRGDHTFISWNIHQIYQAPRKIKTAKNSATKPLKHKENTH